MEWPTFTDQQVIEEAQKAAKTIGSKDILTTSDNGVSEILGYIPEVQYHLFLSTFTKALANFFKGENDTKNRQEGSGVET